MAKISQRSIKSPKKYTTRTTISEGTRYLHVLYDTRLIKIQKSLYISLVCFPKYIHILVQNKVKLILLRYYLKRGPQFIVPILIITVQYICVYIYRLLSEPIHV